MKEQSKGKNKIKFATHVKDIPIPGGMPSPPEHLLKNLRNNMTWAEDSTSAKEIAQAQNELDQWEKIAGPHSITASPEPNYEMQLDSTSIAAVLHVSSEQSRNADTLAFHRAIEDRISAETSYAEIYAKYLELVTFNEKLLRTTRRYQNFKRRVREVYKRAAMGDEHLLDNMKSLQRNLVATEKAMSDLQIENESLRISLASHEAAYRGSLEQIGAQQTQAENVSRQFRNIVEEFENRGILLDEADRKIRAYISEIESSKASSREIQENYAHLRDENLKLQNQMRDVQLKEAGVTALNDELAQAVTKAQRQIHVLEDKMKYQNDVSRARILGLEEEVERLRENRRAEHLVEKSRRMIGAAPLSTEAPAQKPKSEASIAEKIPVGSQATKKQWDDFYHRWSHIIDGLSSHSVPIDRPLTFKDDNSQVQLISEVGDLDIL